MMFKIMSFFDRRGAEWVGLSTALTLSLMILEASGVSSIRVPSWWTMPGGVYTVILGCFVVSKSGNYFIDSKYNTPQGVAPVKPSTTG